MVSKLTVLACLWRPMLRLMWLPSGLDQQVLARMPFGVTRPQPLGLGEGGQHSFSYLFGKQGTVSTSVCMMSLMRQKRHRVWPSEGANTRLATLDEDPKFSLFHRQDKFLSVEKGGNVPYMRKGRDQWGGGV